MALIKKQFNTASWGNAKYGFIYTPDVVGKYPAVVFFHGRGEIGTTNLTADSLKLWGPLHFIDAGWQPNYVVIAIQASYWSPEAGDYRYILGNDPDVVKSWDAKNILWCGLSAGGQRVIDALAFGSSGSFVPMSAAASGAAIDFTKQYKVWAFHDPLDTVCPYNDVKPVYDKIGAKFTPMTGDGHGNWNKYFDPTYRENAMNIYEWAFGAAQPPILPTKKLLQTIIVTTKIFDNGTSETTVT